MSSSSSSSSPQTSGSIGRMAEIPDNGNGSGCWNSTAAIARLRNYGGRVVQMSTGRMAAVINKNWPGFRLVSRNFSICNVTTAAASTLLRPSPLPVPTSVSVPFKRPLSGRWMFRIKRPIFLFFLPDFLLFLLNRLSHRSLTSLSSQCIISRLDQYFPFLGYRAA